MRLTAFVYTGEVFYFDDLKAFRDGLTGGLNTSRPAWSGEWSYYAEDNEVTIPETQTASDRYWRTFYKEHLGERVQTDAMPGMTVGELTEALISKFDQSLSDVTATPEEGGTSEGRPLIRLSYRDNRELQDGFWFLEKPTQAYLVQLAPGTYLEPAADLHSAGVRDGDILGLILARQGRRLYSLIAVPDSAALFAVIRSADGHPPLVTHPLAVDDSYLSDEMGSSASIPGGIWGALLYTDEDEALAAYVRKYFQSLNQLSGDSLYVFVIEKPDPNWRIPLEYWRSRLPQRLFETWIALGWLSSVPYDRSEAYAIARQLGVYEDQLPCLVLFDTPSQREKLIFPLTAATPEYFRTLFGAITRAIATVSPSMSPERRIHARYRSILKSLKASEAKERRSSGVEYNFYGQTVFVNRPLGKVQLPAGGAS
jgi:hypothetical protein